VRRRVISDVKRWRILAQPPTNQNFRNLDFDKLTRGKEGIQIVGALRKGFEA
jgi:hypothetical protein